MHCTESVIFTQEKRSTYEGCPRIFHCRIAPHQQSWCCVAAENSCTDLVLYMALLSKEPFVRRHDLQNVLTADQAANCQCAGQPTTKQPRCVTGLSSVHCSCGRISLSATLTWRKHNTWRFCMPSPHVLLQADHSLMIHLKKSWTEATGVTPEGGFVFFGLEIITLNHKKS